jgi:hypothetical protein
MLMRSNLASDVLNHGKRYLSVVFITRSMRFRRERPFRVTQLMHVLRKMNAVVTKGIAPKGYSPQHPGA